MRSLIFVFIYSSCTVLIELLNINDETPEFINTPYNFSLYENTPPNKTHVGLISVQDKDGNDVTVSIMEESKGNVTKTCLYSFDPLKSHFYTVKLGFTGVYINFLISAQKHRLWVLVRTASPT